MITGLEIKDYLLKHSDVKYCDFNKKINVSTSYKQLGVRIPILKDYAKKLKKTYSLEFLLETIDEEYFEEVMLKGILIGLYSLTGDELITYINYYVPKIDDWALCDIFCSGLKNTKKYYKDVFVVLENYLKMNNEFTVRFSLVMLLNYYLNDDYLDKIEEIIVNVCTDKYYAKMANAWLLSYYIIKYYNRALLFIKTKKIDKWTLDKAISKCLDSKRLTNHQKDMLRKIKKSRYKKY